MDTIGNMLGGMIGPELDRLGTQAVCTSANYMSLAAANEEIPIPQVPLGPSINWGVLMGGFNIGALLGGLPGGFGEPSRPIHPWSTEGSYYATEGSYQYGGRRWRTNSDSFNFTFTPAMLDFRQQILERAFGPDMDGPGMNGPDMFGPDMAGPNMQQFKDEMMEPLVPKLMCAISEGTRKCECSNEFNFEDAGIGFLFLNVIILLYFCVNLIII